MSTRERTRSVTPAWPTVELQELIPPHQPNYGIVKPGPEPRQGEGVSYVCPEDIVEGRVDIRRLRRTSIRISNEYQRTVLERGDVIISVRATLDRVAIVTTLLAGANLSRGVARLTPNQKVDPDFLAWTIRSETSQRWIKFTARGLALQGLNLGDLNHLPVPLPGLPEQRAIATALSDADALIAALDDLIAKKRAMKQGAMQQLLTGRTRLPGFGGEWEKTSFGQVATPRKERVDPSRLARPSFCVELEHIEPETGKLIGGIETSPASSLKSVFQPGDVLFGKLRAYLRKYWLADRGGVCSTEIWVITPKRDVTTSEYLFHLVSTDSFADAASMAYGTHMPRSDWNIVKAHPVKLPSKPEQVAIASVLSDMDAEIRAFEGRREKMRAIKQGMMQQLLTGRIRLVAPNGGAEDIQSERSGAAP
jgi:type I restriction enzyme, S subunit